jgi:hypothetical protein
MTNSGFRDLPSGHPVMAGSYATMPGHPVDPATVGEPMCSCVSRVSQSELILKNITSGKS